MMVRITEGGATDTAERGEARRAIAHERLLAWYADNGRTHLPWRHTRDPYAILVSEVMLQQTQVERVLPRYREFLRRFPSLEALAAAPTAEVIKAWAGLGYNMRAVRLHRVAQQAVTEYGGVLPATLEGLQQLKGIGRYTAGAVACFAFGQPIATVDTNIRRVLWRVFRGIEPATWPTGEKAAQDALALAQWALPPEQAYDWQQALMDLGATICVSKRPLCERCPLRDCCAAFEETALATLFPSGEALARLRDERDVAAPAEATGIAEQPEAYVTSVHSGTIGTPARRARAPRVRFEETSRYFRGRIVHTLRDLDRGETLSLEDLGPRVKEDYTADDTAWLRGLVQGLARDGLVRIETTADGVEHVGLP